MKHNMESVSFEIENYRDKFNYFHVERYVSPGYGAHMHRNPELYCVNKGYVKVCIDKEEYALTEGEAVFIDNLRIHSYECTDADITFVLIGNKYLQPFHELYCDRQIPTLLTDKHANAALFGYLDTISSKCENFQPLERYACVYNILNLIVNAYGTVPKPQKKTRTRAELSEIIQYIYDNAAQNLSLNSLAEQFNYDPISLSHIFSRYIKTDIRNFINNIRIQNYLDLKSLPANKDKSVIELAMQCGFSNTATFYRAYKKAMEE